MKKKRLTDLLTGELVITFPLSRLYKEGNKSSWKARGFITKRTVHIYYQKIGNIKKATAKVFGGSQDESKVRIKYFEIKITELHLVWVWFGGYIKRLELSGLQFTGRLKVLRNVLVIYLQGSFTDAFRLLNTRS